MKLSINNGRLQNPIQEIRLSGWEGRKQTTGTVQWCAMDLENWCSWSDLPECYGTWETVYKRFAQWQENGKLKALFVQLREDADIQDLCMYGT